MNLFLNGVAKAMAGAFTLPEPIMEIGSYQVAGQEDIINLRSLFPTKDYIGVDFREGPGVDCVANVENLPHETGSVGTVIAFSTFEHVQRFWKGFDEVHRVLKPNGVFLVSCPFYFHVHAYPSDYWRFTPQAFDLLLENYPTRILGWHGPERRYANVWAAAFKSNSNAPSDAEFAKYLQLMDAYAKEPLPWHRRLRYQLGRTLCGRRPFAPHLDREKWETVIHRGVSKSAAA